MYIKWRIQDRDTHGSGGGGGAYFLKKKMPEGPKNIFFETLAPSEGLDPPVIYLLWSRLCISIGSGGSPTRSIYQLPPVKLCVWRTLRPPGQLPCTLRLHRCQRMHCQSFLRPNIRREKRYRVHKVCRTLPQTQFCMTLTLRNRKVFVYILKMKS